MKVSVVIPVFNGEATIAETLESVFAQRFDGGFEVIVVNDGSTDGTRAVLEKYGDRIRVIDQPRGGVSGARNTGIREAAGEYIALLDADDTWTEDKLAKTVTVLERNPAVVAVFSDSWQVDGAGKVIVSYFVPPHQAHAPTLDEMLEQCWEILPSASVIRRETLLATGGFSEEFAATDYGFEDVFAFLLIRERGEIAFVPDKLARYRISEFNFAKRIRPGVDGSKAGTDEFEDPQRVFGGFFVFARLTRDHFGARGRPLARYMVDRVGFSLVSFGLTAMHEGNRARAIRYYRMSLRYRPLDPKTYVRMAWAALPAGIAGKFTGILTPRLWRSLSGPPFTTSEEWPQ
jgi:glycosyltransferase involved in cell wall biosynthesis